MKINSGIYISRFREVFMVTIALGLFVFGSYIYIVFRPMSLYMFSWFESINVMDSIETIRHNSLLKMDSSFIIYSLPNGLWAASYILIMDAIWATSRKMQIFFSSIIPIVGISSELLQCAGILKGTFDTRDLICYALPYIVYVLLKSIIK